MDSTEVTILGLVITSLITIAGWGVTYWKQKQILEEQRKHSRADRELMAFRERARTVSEMTTRLTSISIIADSLAQLVSRGAGTSEEHNRAFSHLMSELSEISMLASTHDFRIVRDAVGVEKVKAGL